MKELFEVSASRLKTFLDCKHAYWAKYCHLPKMPDEVGDKTRLGSVLHEVLECMGRPKKSIRRSKYIVFSQENRVLHPVIEKLYRKIYKRFSVKDLYEDGEEMLIETFKSGLDLTCAIDVEKRFSLPVSGSIAIKGFIDTVCELDPKTLEIADYKSGRPYSPKDSESDLQPFFYLEAADKLYPKYPNKIFTFHFLKNGKSYTIAPKTEKQRKRFMSFAISKAVEMQKIRKQDVVAVKSWKCKFCNWKAPKPEYDYAGCPLFCCNGKLL